MDNNTGDARDAGKGTVEGSMRSGEGSKISAYGAVKKVEAPLLIKKVVSVLDLETVRRGWRVLSGTKDLQTMAATYNLRYPMDGVGLGPVVAFCLPCLRCSPSSYL